MHISWMSFTATTKLTLSTKRIPMLIWDKYRVCYCISCSDLFFPPQSSVYVCSNEVSTKEALMVFFAVFGGHILMALLIYCCVKNGRHRNCSCNCCRKPPPLTQSVRSRVTSSTALNTSAGWLMWLEITRRYARL